MSHHEQRVCRGAVVLRGKWPVLVVAVRGALCAVVPLAAPCLPHHRADVPLKGCSAVRGHIARCGTPVLVRAGGLSGILGMVSVECLRRVDDLVTVGTFLVALCALLARFWPRPAEGSRWLKLYELVNSVAQNKGHAANADDAAGKPASG